MAGAGALAVGDLLLLHEVASPRTGEAADADPTRRHIVRLTRVTAPVTDVLSPDALVDVAWGASDALPFDLVVSALVEQTAGPPRRSPAPRRRATWYSPSTAPTCPRRRTWPCRPRP